VLGRLTPGARLRPGRSGGADRGSAIVEFALVSVLLIFVLFAVLQVVILFYLHTIVASAATDGARWAGQSGTLPGAGAQRSRLLIAQGSTERVARDVRCQQRVGRDADSGLETAVVQCAGRVRSIFLPLGSLITINVTARAVREGPA
jgi:Flp pilus assembly protein TadG